MVELTLGEYSWETFREAERRVSHLAAGLYSMLGPIRNKINPIAIFSETRAEWLYAAQAAFRLNRPVVTLYATLGDDALVHGFNEAEVSWPTGASMVFFSSTLLIFKTPRCTNNDVEFSVFYPGFRDWFLSTFPAIWTSFTSY